MHAQAAQRAGRVEHLVRAASRRADEPCTARHPPAHRRRRACGARPPLTLRRRALGPHSNWPGVLRLFADRAEYAFSHPRHRRVQMVMRYRDMSQLGLSRSSGTLAFRIEHNLEYFAHEYNHYDETHRLVLTLGTAADVDALTTSGAWARMQALCLSRS